VQVLRSSDPWLDADSTYSGPVLVDSMVVDVQARDLGEKLNINLVNETELQTFFSFLLGDYSKSTQLAQSIMDWRDVDSMPRPSGAERDAYIKAEMLALPTNGPFREIEELQNVMGMTPEIYAAASPYLTTHGSDQVNLNTAPVPVLRSLPGMTDATLNRILQMRSQGRRITSVEAIFPTAQGGRRIAGQLGGQIVINQINARATVDTRQLELTITSRVGPQATPTKLIAVIANNKPQAVVLSKQW
jgi:general secretion pathway protein K